MKSPNVWYACPTNQRKSWRRADIDVCARLVASICNELIKNVLFVAETWCKLLKMCPNKCGGCYWSKYKCTIVIVFSAGVFDQCSTDSTRVWMRCFHWSCCSLPTVVMPFLLVVKHDFTFCPDSSVYSSGLNRIKTTGLWPIF